VQDSIGFELHQPRGVDEPSHLHHGVGGPNVAKEVAVGAVTASQSSMRVRRVRVRMTSAREAPASASALSMI